MGRQADRGMWIHGILGQSIGGEEVQEISLLDPFNLLFLIGQSSAHGALIPLHFQQVRLPG